MWPPDRGKARHLVQLLRLNLDILFASGLLLPVLLHPGLKSLAGGSIASGKRQRGDLRIRNRKLGTLLPAWNHPHIRVAERFAVAAVEYVSLHLRAILARDRNVASIIESFLQRLAHVG